MTTVSTRELYITDTLIEGPTLEPIDLDEVKRHLRFTSTSEDTLLDTYIAMARQYFEEATGRQLMDALRERRFEGAPYANTAAPYPLQLIELPYPPLLEVVSIAYTVAGSPDEALLVEDVDYLVEAPAGPYARRGFVSPIVGGSWPSPSGLGSLRIRYRAGYGSQSGDVPEIVRGALYFLVGYFHKFRAEVQEGFQGSVQSMPIGADSIIRAFKYSALPSQPPLRTTWPG